MLPADARLRRGADIRAVRRAGARAGADGVMAYLLAASARPQDPAVATRTRATVVVGRAAGPAVARNRLRRRVRHSVARQWALVPPGADLVLSANAGAARLGVAGLDRAVASAIERAAGRAAGRAQRAAASRPVARA